MKKLTQIILALTLAFVPTVSTVLTPAEVEAKSTPKACQEGYFRSPQTGRCKKIKTVTESTSTITTTIYNTETGQPSVYKTCKNGYWWNAKTGRCNKKKTCKIGYRYLSYNNTCQRIVCPFGFKVQDASNVCKRIVCEKGHIINQKTGNCVINRHGKYKTCEAGWTLDLRTLKCAKIGTKGSDDPRSKKSQSTAVQYELKSTRSLASIIKTTDSSSESSSEKSETTETKKDCGEGKFLNPKTNRCKNLQTVSETSTGKTITTYDPETGEATVEKICNEGYYLNTETNRCNKEKTDSSSSSSSSTKTSSTVKNTETKTCPEGKVLNPATNRCKNRQTVKETTTGKTVTTFNPETGEETTEKICNEGYTLNEETNRCVKKKENKGEDYKLEVPELGSEEKKDFVAIGSVLAIVAIGVVLVIFQFRKEILTFFKRIVHRKKA